MINPITSIDEAFVSEIFKGTSESLLDIRSQHPLLFLKRYFNDNDNIIYSSDAIDRTLFDFIEHNTQKVVQHLYLTMDSYMNENYDVDILQNHEWEYFYKIWIDLWKTQTNDMVIKPIIKLQASFRRMYVIRKWVRELNEYNFYGCGFR
jgi:hypothetical protein